MPRYAAMPFHYRHATPLRRFGALRRFLSATVYDDCRHFLMNMLPCWRRRFRDEALPYGERQLLPYDDIAYAAADMAAD